MTTDNTWIDPLYLEDILTDQEKMIKKTTHKFCENFLYPEINKKNNDSHFDKEIYKEFGSLGLLGSTIDGYGYSNISPIRTGKQTSMLQLLPEKGDQIQLGSLICHDGSFTCPRGLKSAIWTIESAI